MPNTNWSELSPLQLGKYAEYYAKMEFASYKYDIYTSELDDHGIDFIAKNIKTGVFFEVQVKSMLKTKYVFIPKDKLILDERYLVCLLHFTNGELPKVYIIPAIEWKKPNTLLVEHDYENSKSEWGINYSAKNINLLNNYKSENYFK